MNTFDYVCKNMLVSCIRDQQQDTDDGHTTECVTNIYLQHNWIMQ